MSKRRRDDGPHISARNLRPPPGCVDAYEFVKGYPGNPGGYEVLAYCSTLAEAADYWDKFPNDHTRRKIRVNNIAIVNIDGKLYKINKKPLDQAKFLHLPDTAATSNADLDASWERFRQADEPVNKAVNNGV